MMKPHMALIFQGLQRQRGNYFFPLFDTLQLRIFQIIAIIWSKRNYGGATECNLYANIELISRQKKTCALTTILLCKKFDADSSFSLSFLSEQFLLLVLASSPNDACSSIYSIIDTQQGSLLLSTCTRTYVRRYIYYSQLPSLFARKQQLFYS